MGKGGWKVVVGWGEGTSRHGEGNGTGMLFFFFFYLLFLLFYCIFFFC